MRAGRLGVRIREIMAVSKETLKGMDLMVRERSCSCSRGVRDVFELRVMGEIGW